MDWSSLPSPRRRVPRPARHVHLQRAADHAQAGAHRQSESHHGLRRRLLEFLLHADKAAEQFGVDARDILVELGKLKVVGGQEDMIVEVAMMLAEKQKQGANP